MKVQLAVLHDLLFTDDCALVAHTPAELQLLFDWFFNAAKPDRQLEEDRGYVPVISTEPDSIS